MTSHHFILISLWHHRRVHLAVAAGVAVATAVVCGALLVGDSVRGSLRDLTLERLGRIDSVLVAGHPFHEALADEIPSAEVAPLLLTQGTLAHSQAKQGQEKQSRRATRLSVVGCTDAFWKLGRGGPSESLGRDAVAIGGNVARELDARVGDEVLLRVPLVAHVSADSTLGEKVDTLASRRLTVAAVLPAERLARFGLRPSQQLPRNVFVSLATLQDLLEIPGEANALAVAREEASPWLTGLSESSSLSPRLSDFGLSVQRVSLADCQQPTADSFYLLISSDRLVLPPHVVDMVRQEFTQTEVQPVITYLANTIAVGDRKIPYSTVTGIDSSAALGPLLGERGQPMVLAEDEIVLNDWAAKELDANVGDQVTLKFYEPEATHGKPIERRPPLQLRLRAIVPLLNQQGQPTLAADRHLTPELEGVTDQTSISDWDLPFELVETIRPQDETYWDQYAATPKAFVSYALAEQLWHTRWSAVSGLRLPTTGGLTVEKVQHRLRQTLDPARLGMTWLPVKQQGLQAASGTTPFDSLFLGFSFFLMASALMLVALLFRLGIEQRASELGTLLATGMTATRLRRLCLAESVVVATVGALFGTVAGVAYARLMIHGLGTWWIAATVTPFLKLHVTWTSLLLGFAIGIGVALGTIAWSLRRFVRLPVRQLLAGDCDFFASPTSRLFRPTTTKVPAVAIGLAMVLAVVALRWEGETQAGAFFGSGSLVLCGLLIALRQKLRRPRPDAPATLSLTKLAALNGRRNPSRTILTVGLAAVASFLIVALGAFRLSPTDRGTGRFDLIATADLPLHFDLNTPAGRLELGFSDREEAKLAGGRIESFRVQPGEDASCLNLYQTTQPRVLGVPQSFYGTSHFAWASHAALENKTDDPWQLLQTDLGADPSGQPIVPVILDRNTAYYSLKRYHVGAQYKIRDATDQPVTCQIVGLLAGSVLQGDLLIGETDFQRLFPDTAGTRFFLIGEKKEAGTLLETRLEDYGFDVTDAHEQLACFFAVQNTYLSTFQSLGGLGLLLGTIGLAVVQLRSVQERRGELALLGCVGFRRNRLARLVLSENVVLLLSGLGIGSAAALVAVLPHWLLQQAATPWAMLAAMLVLILLAGVAASWLAVQATLRVPLLPALRGD